MDIPDTKIGPRTHADHNWQETAILDYLVRFAMSILAANFDGHTTAIGRQSLTSLMPI